MGGEEGPAGGRLRLANCQTMRGAETHHPYPSVWTVPFPARLPEMPRAAAPACAGDTLKLALAAFAAGNLLLVVRSLVCACVMYAAKQALHTPRSAWQDALAPSKHKARLKSPQQHHSVRTCSTGTLSLCVSHLHLSATHLVCSSTTPPPCPPRPSSCQCCPRRAHWPCPPASCLCYARIVAGCCATFG